MPQPIVGLLRQTYPEDFAQVPDIAVGDYFYRLMFKPESFGTVKQGQGFRRQALSDLRQVAAQAMPGVVPEADKEFVIWARKQALDLAPMESPDLKQQREFSNKAFQYEQKFGDLAHPILFTEEFARNLVGKPTASLVSVASIIPGVSRETSTAVANAISPRIDFAHQLSEKYGTVAGLAYSFGEALIGFGVVAGGTRALAVGVAASRIPLVARAAGAIAANEVAFNTAFFGAYSAGEYNRARIQAGEEPDVGGFAANLAAGSALGALFPKARGVFIEAKQGRRWTNQVLLPMLEKRIDDLKKLNRPQLTAVLAEKGIVRTTDVNAAIRSVGYAKSYTGNLARKLLAQSTRAGALGVGMGAVAQATQGMPIDLPSLVENGVMMMGFHAYGLLGAPKRLPRVKVREVPDGVIRIGRDNDIMLEATRSIREQPDRAIELNMEDFNNVIRRSGAQRIEVEKGEFKPLSEFTDALGLTNPAGEVRTALDQLGKAELAGDRIMESRLAGRLNQLMARIARGRGESPTEVPFTDAIREQFLDEATFTDNISAKKAQELYLNLRQAIGRTLGPDARRAFETGLEGNQLLSERAAAGDAEATRILRQFPQADATERLFAGILRGGLQSEQYQALYDAARTYLAAPSGAIYPPGRAMYEPPAVVPSREVVPAAAPPLVSREARAAPRAPEEGLPVFAAPERPAERPAVEKPPTEAKKPWQMTKAEYEKSLKEAMGVTEAGVEVRVLGPTHKEMVARAVERGMPVPKEVLTDYPDLAKKPPAKPTREPTPKPAPKAEEVEWPKQPKWEETATVQQFGAIYELRDRIKKPSHIRKLMAAYADAKGWFKDVPKEDWPEEIAKAERLIKIEKDKKARVKGAGEEKKKVVRQRPDEYEEAIGELEQRFAKLKEEGLTREFYKEEGEWRELVKSAGEISEMVARNVERKRVKELDKRFDDVREGGRKWFDEHWLEEPAGGTDADRVHVLARELNDAVLNRNMSEGKSQFEASLGELMESGLYERLKVKDIAGVNAEERTSLLETVAKALRIHLARHDPARLAKLEQKGALEKVAEGEAEKVPTPELKGRQVKGIVPEDGRRLIDVARKIGPDPGRMNPNMDVALSAETLPELIHTAENLGIKTKLSKALELNPNEQVEEVNKVYHGIRKAIHSSTRQTGDKVETVYGPGRVNSYNPKTYEYEVFDYGTGRVKIVKWDMLEVPTDKTIHKTVSDVANGLKAGGVPPSETFDALNKSKGDVKLYGGIPFDLSVFFKGKSKAKARQAFEKNPELAEKFMESGRSAHSWSRDGEPFLASLSRYSANGDPRKLVTPKQWQWIQDAIEFNKQNPHMRGPGGSIDAADFMYAVLGRSNFHPELAREVGKPYEPLSRNEARLLLKEFGRISEVIRKRNWPLAMNVYLTSETKKYNPHIERCWDNLLTGMYEHNGLIAEGSRRLSDALDRVKSFRKINSRTQTREFFEYSKKNYDYIWGNEKINSGKVDRWGTEGRDFGDEVYGLLTGVIPWNEPFVSSEALHVARSLGRPEGKAPSFRDRWWYFFDRGLQRFVYPMQKGLLLANNDAFRDAYVRWKLASGKTTPENADAMRARLEKEADGIIANDELRLETVTRMIDSKKLGKITDAKGRSRYYPQYDPETVAQKLIAEENDFAAGYLPRGGFGEPVYMQRRRAEIEYWVVKNKGKWDPVKDWNTYFQTVSNYIWRARVRAETWWSIKRLRQDIAENPYYADLFQKHIEIVEKLRSNLLDRPEGLMHNVSQNLGFLASAIMLAHPKTVFRNYIGGHTLTVIHNGLSEFGKAWDWRKTADGRRVLNRAGFEAAALFSEAASAHVNPRQMQQQIKQGKVFGKGPAELQFEGRMTNVIRLLTSYALTRPVPFVTDLIPGLQKILKPAAFAGSEIPLREIAFSAGYLGGRDAVLNGEPRYDKVRTIYGNNAKEIAAKALKNYGEIMLEDEILRGIVENPSKVKGAKKYMLQIVGRETDAELRARAHRTGLRSGIASVTFTQFEYSNLNTPSIMRHPLGRIILLFRKYTWNRIAFANRIIKESFPQYGGGKTELGRLLRFGFVLSAAQALSVWVGLNFYRFVEDDVVSMLSSISDWFSGDEGKRRAFFGKPWWQFLSGAELSRMIDVIKNAEMETWEKVIIASHVPYGRALADAVREWNRVNEGRKNVFESLLNYHIGLYRQNYGGAGRPRRAMRR